MNVLSFESDTLTAGHKALEKMTNRKDHNLPDVKKLPMKIFGQRELISIVQHIDK